MQQSETLRANSLTLKQRDTLMLYPGFSELVQTVITWFLKVQSRCWACRFGVSRAIMQSLIFNTAIMKKKVSLALQTANRENVFVLTSLIELYFSFVQLVPCHARQNLIGQWWLCHNKASSSHTNPRLPTTFVGFNEGPAVAQTLLLTKKTTTSMIQRIPDNMILFESPW